MTRAWRVWFSDESDGQSFSSMVGELWEETGNIRVMFCSLLTGITAALVLVGVVIETSGRGESITDIPIEVAFVIIGALVGGAFVVSVLVADIAFNGPNPPSSED